VAAPIDRGVRHSASWKSSGPTPCESRGVGTT
jgi:hypothetical protein